MPERHRRYRCARPGFGDDTRDVQGCGNATAAAGFVGLLSLFNMGGRFFWSSASDSWGARILTSFSLRSALGSTQRFPESHERKHGAVCVVVCDYHEYVCGGFSTIPSLFGRYFWHPFRGWHSCRLLTAWSTAGVLGPVLVNYIREFQIEQGTPKADAYNVTMYIMAGILVFGFVCNLLIRPVHEKHHMNHDEFDELDGAFPRRDA